MSPANCTRCGRAGTDRYCSSCEDALLEAAAHMASYCADLRTQRDDLAQSVRDLERALSDCAAEVARLKAAQP